ncbi:MAG: hypothetical protein JSS66_18830 [Armatimonadetes bacterium]|nr:hypothetical protein [Armatimonadota bacterium]
MTTANDNRTTRQMFEDSLAQDRAYIAERKARADAASRAFDAVADGLERSGIPSAFTDAFRKSGMKPVVVGSGE